MPFATVPAYLADLFGTQMVGAIHGRLLTAWAAAGVLGPVLVNYLREYQLSIGVERAAAYDITLYILAGLLVLGFICNLLVRPVADKYFMTDAYTMTLPAKLAQLGNATVIVTYAERLPRGRGFVVRFVPFDGALDGSSAEQAQAINHAMERLIARNPAQYYWSYNRYKVPHGVIAPNAPGSTGDAA